jgi:hypothetical protein
MRWKAFDLAFLERQVSAASRLIEAREPCPPPRVQHHRRPITADLQILLYEYAPMGTLHDALHGKTTYLLRALP